MWIIEFMYCSELAFGCCKCGLELGFLLLYVRRGVLTTSVLLLGVAGKMVAAKTLTSDTMNE